MRLVKKMGFGYEKRGRQRIISERPEIIAWRERYLRRIRKIREADPERAIVYTDEKWLNQGHRTKKEWVDLETLKEKNLRSLRLSGLTVGCTKEMTGTGRRLIISDAMTESGPVRGALWMFKADGKRKKEKNWIKLKRTFRREETSQIGFWKHRKEWRYSRRGWKWLWNSRRYSLWRRLSWFHVWGKL